MGAGGSLENQLRKRAGKRRKNINAVLQQEHQLFETHK
jgi:hypothetical protein